LFHLSRRDTLCINVTQPYTTLVLHDFNSTLLSVFWRVNRRVLLVKQAADPNLGILDFGDQIGNLELRPLATETSVSFSLLQFPKRCGARRFVSNDLRSPLGLSSSIGRSDFVTNGEVFCFWMIAPKKFSFRASPATSLRPFALELCEAESDCRRVKDYQWRTASSLNFFQFDNVYDIYPSAFAVQFRPRNKRMAYQIAGLLSATNFTEYPKTKWAATGSGRAKAIALITFVAGTFAFVGTLICISSIRGRQKESTPQPSEMEGLLPRPVADAQPQGDYLPVAYQ
jgi:hypothetical protein